ncbi:uncharacterized protein LOC121862224 [Homarus americanus]|uniref:Uncharacterized protein n=1 Tax=Homarus americanus TaxID=6706 RepID=A0A8J5N2W1_HOMAM|nr:uncharacterized protein LOC121862224 [Homarus americanus]KAG7172161.1 hypothetical protein Hamer_G028801 [Homarus americanus]
MDVIGVRVVVYVLVSLSFMAQLGSTLVTLCTLETNSITLERDERALFKADEDIVEIYMRSLSTGLIGRYSINVPQDLATNPFMTGNDYEWYEMTYTANDTHLIVIIRGNNTLYIEEKWTSNSTNEAPSLEFTFTGIAKLGTFCFDQPLSVKLLHVLDNVDYSGKPYRPTPPSENYHYSSYSGGHIIFIPVGAIIFFISICCRCCYRRKKILQPVRSIDVVMNVPDADTTPSGCDRTQGDNDLPPSYTDIQTEIPPPPPYSEIEKQNIPSSNTSPLEEILIDPAEDVTDHTNTGVSTENTPTGLDSPVDSTNVDSTNTNSVSSSNMLARVFSSRPSAQFAFKPLKEEH